ncbi:MAG: hypothetical protein HY286_19555 [Planctomycetes bacterium]|nr:hypothetical protein [Planctomycetota bacterium]
MRLLKFAPPAYLTKYAAWLTGIYLAFGHGIVSAEQVPARYTPPTDISVDGHLFDSLFILVTWMILGLFVAMTAILIYSMIAFRQKPGKRAVYEKGDSKKDAVKSVAFAIAIFLGVDGPLLGFSHRDVIDNFWNFPNTKEIDNDKDVLRVEVLAQQWAWNFRYAGKDGKFNTADDIVTLNDFRVPVGRKVLLQLTSKDVIHSMFLPNCRIKRDANPGEITRMWFQTKNDAVGDYQIACAQMCGYAHYLMQGSFKVLSEQQWTDWYGESARISENWATAQNEFEGKHAELKARNNYSWGWEWKSQPPQ